MWSCKRKRLKPGPYSSSSFSSGLGTRLHTAILNEDPPCPPLAFSKWSQTSRQPATAEGSKQLSMPLVTCHMFTSLRKSLVSWATILVTWGEIAPPFKSSNQIAECTIMIIFWTKTITVLLHTFIKHLQTIVCTILQRFHQSLECKTILCTDHIPCDMKCHSDPQTLLLLSRRVWGQTSTTFTQ